MSEASEKKTCGLDRRRFLAHASALGATSVFSASRIVAAEPPPEVRRVRMLSGPAICRAPQLIAEQLLLSEGFSNIEWVNTGRVIGASAIAQGLADISIWDVHSTLAVLDAGGEVVVLAGIHAGCWELFGNDRISTLRDLKGKTIAIRAFNLGDHVLLCSMLAYVGVDPRNTINWVAGPAVTDAMPLFVNGKADAFVGFPPQPQEMRAKKIGHVIVDTAKDRPWSQYYCCAVIAGRKFVHTNPVATKRILRAFLKAADICAQEPERAASLLAKKGYEPRQSIGLEVLKSLPYDRWRQIEPEDTLRFYALRLHEVGMIRTTPQKLITDGTDWRFLNELRTELKA